MNKNQILTKYALFFEDKHFVQRTDSEKLDRVDRLKGALMSRAARLTEERNREGAQRALNQVGKLVRYGTNTLKSKVYKVKLVGRFRYETAVNAESKDEAIERAFREASVASKGVSLFQQRAEKCEETSLRKEGLLERKNSKRK